MASSNDVIEFSEKKLFTLFAEVDGLQKKRPTTGAYCQKISSFLPSSCTQPNVDILRTSIRKYTRKKDQKLSSSQIIESASNNVIYSVVISSSSVSSQHSFVNSSSQESSIPLDEKPPARKKSRGPVEFSASFSTSYKQFDALTERQRSDKTQPLIDMLKNFLNHNSFSIILNLHRTAPWLPSYERKYTKEFNTSSRRKHLFRNH